MGYNIFTENISIVKNFITKDLIVGISNNFEVLNNIVEGVLMGGCEYCTGRVEFNSIGAKSGTWINGGFNLNSIVKNNIFNVWHYSGYTPSVSTMLQFKNNVLASNFFQGSDSSNLPNQTNDSIYMRTHSNMEFTPLDQQYKLSPNSPAKGFAIGGYDCGAYGGPDPYVPSGYPATPRITDFEIITENQPTGTVQFRIKAVPGNE
jgi:hypothetical protein